MTHLFKRHPISVEAFFRHALVLTYAFPKEILSPLLPPGLVLDTYKDFGFLAVALVQTENMRPTALPASFGRNFFLTGYRIFSRFLAASGTTLRGLRILRSDTDRSAMVFFGNLLTHYHYQKADVSMIEKDQLLEVRIKTPGAVADLHILADLASQPAPLPQGSPFDNFHDARRFAGPLPFTFDYEKETHSIIRIRGVRENWDPQPVRVKVFQNTFLNHEPFCDARPILANSFHVENITYRWEQGIREKLKEAKR